MMTQELLHRVHLCRLVQVAELHVKDHDHDCFLIYHAADMFDHQADTFSHRLTACLNNPDVIGDLLFYTYSLTKHEPMTLTLRMGMLQYQLCQKQHALRRDKLVGYFISC